jgi:putative inorganic carbon (HCO3(-)) transporter
MPLRDITLLIIWLGLIPISLVHPWIGILAWYWIAYFVPHGLVWGFARNLPVALAIGGATLVGFLFTRDKKPLPRSAITSFMVLFVVHIALTTILAHNRANAFGKWVWVNKVLLMTFVMMCLFQDRARLRWLYRVAALGLGFYGFKGGIWVLLTGGGELVLGPEQSFFADNNTLGLALCMNLPVLLYLSREETRPWLRSFLRLVFGLSIIAIIFTYSRGAFLGLLTVLCIIIWRSPWRLRFAVAIVLVALIGAPLAPQRLWTRLDSITKQDSAETRDRSATERIEAWKTSLSIAVTHPLTGAGFRALDNPDLWYLHFGPGYIATSDAHSLYFELLGSVSISGRSSARC